MCYSSSFTVRVQIASCDYAWNVGTCIGTTLPDVPAVPTSAVETYVFPLFVIVVCTGCFVRCTGNIGSIPTTEDVSFTIAYGANAESRVRSLSVMLPYVVYSGYIINFLIL